MYSLFQRQRRRLNLFAAFAAVPFAMVIFASIWPVWGPASAILVAVIAGLCLMVPPLLILHFAPRFRSICEGLVIGLIVGSAFQLATLPLADLPVIGPWRAVIGMAGFALFFYLDILNRLFPAQVYKGSDSFRTMQSAYTIWAEHLPDPGLLDRHWSDEMHELILDRSNPRLRTVTYHTPQGVMRQRQEMTDETTHCSFAYDFTQLLDDGSDGPTGSYALSIADHGPYRDVTISQRVDSLPIMAWLSSWLDDAVGDECDHHQARGNKRADTSITGNRMRKTPHRLVGPAQPVGLAA